jgi:hypothetical protein
MRRRLAAVLLLVAARAPVAAAAADGAARTDVDRQLAATLAAALPTDGATDVALIDHPSASGAPRVRAATIVGAPPATIRALLLDPAQYPLILPGIVRADPSPASGGATTLDWEIEIPLFNLSGRIVMRPRPDGAELQLVDGDLAPGRIVFTIAPRPGGSTLVVDAQLDVKNSTFVLRRMMARSPVGEPAGLAATTYVALRGVALRAEHAAAGRVWRPAGPIAPPSGWLPDPRPLADPKLAPLRARGALALVARQPSHRLGGVAVTFPIAQPAPAIAGRLQDPATWRAFPGWKSVEPHPGPHGAGAVVEDSLPLADFDATWTADAGGPLRWTVTEGDTSGARLGWSVQPGPDGNALATLLLYPRLETTGRVARRAIASEPLLELGLALGLAFADAAGAKAALDGNRPR